MINLYKHSLFAFFALNEIILKMPGIRYNNKGYIKDNPKLIRVSLIRWICVFLYTAQKHDK